MTIEWAAIIVDNIVGYILDQSGFGEALRSKLRHDPEKQAFKRALTQAFEQFQQEHPEAAASLFNLDFFKEVVTALLNALHDTSPRVRQEAIRSLARAGQTLPEVVTLLYNILHQDTDSDVRYAAAVSLGELDQMATDVITILVHALQDAQSWSVRRDSVRLLGQVEQVDETIIEVLWQGLLDENSTVRTSCVEALAQLGRRFPSTAVPIGGKLVQAIEGPSFDKLDNKMRSAHEYAFNGLWLMVVSGEVLVEEY